MKLIRHNEGDLLFVSFGYAMLGLFGAATGGMFGHHSNLGRGLGFAAGFLFAFLAFDIDWRRK